MADIFLSYCREDIERARLVATSLEAEGFSVWWDQQLIPGVRYSAETESVLRSTSVILVLWTPNSINSMWVADEAMVGRDQGNLVPVSFDQARPPIGFRQIQTMSLDGWNGEPASATFRMLIAAIRKTIENGESPRVQHDPPVGEANRIAAAPAASRLTRLLGGVRTHRAIAAAALAALVAIAAPLVFSSNRNTPHLKGGADADIAVPPFKVSGDNPDLQWLSQGMAATLERSLRASGVQTKGYDFPGAGNDRELERYIDELDVDYVLDGLVTRIGPDLVFNVKLVDAKTKATIEAIEQVELADVDFAVMQNVVNAVVSKITGADSPEKEVRRQSKAYLIALGLTSDAALMADFEKASELLRSVAEAEPDNGDAFAQLAYALASIDRLEDRSDRHAEEARDAIKRAFTLLGENSEAYFASGLVEYVYRVDADRLRRAREAFARAIDLDPGNVRAIKWMTSVLIQLGDYDEAITFADKALAISPDYLDALGNRISALIFVGRRNEARADLDRILEKKPDWSFAHRMRASLALADGDLVTMLNHTRTADEIEPIVLNARLESIAFSNLDMQNEANVAIERDGELSHLDPAWRAYKRQIVSGDVEGALRSLDGLLSHEMREAKRADPLMAAGFLRIYLSDFAGAHKNCSEAQAYNVRILGDDAAMTLAGACVAIAAARLGDRSGARALADAYRTELEGLSGEYRPYWDQSILASLQLAVGDREKALNTIRDMVRQGWRTPKTAICRHCVHLAIDDNRGLFGQLNDDPAFLDLMSAVKTDLAAQRSEIH
ncbi:MAG: TIR domain-containing protein [Parvularculaceae bacterium]|nr:TIR domain-containing protein [Parvularculaceae bacterium]